MSDRFNYITFVLIILVIIIFSLIFLNYNRQKPDDDSVFCTEEAKLCPDGSYVSRNSSLNCQFDSCPIFDDNGNNENDSEQHFCTPEEREGDFCVEIYNPVCGFFNPEKIQCIRYPCASKYSNSCFACKNEDVLYWTEGECPSS